jgi:hypothetical protein
MSCAIVAAHTSRLPWRRSNLVRRRRYSQIEGRRLLAGLGSVVAYPHKGPAVTRPLDRGATANDVGTAATMRWGQGAAVTAATGRGPPSHALSVGDRYPPGPLKE